jgi:NAD(P)-dependent dehydrogenase (short-subunit alcohol dehydrogenase family)
MLLRWQLPRQLRSPAAVPAHPPRRMMACLLRAVSTSNGSNAVVQGAAGGIGREVVRKLFDRGATTVIGVDLRLRDAATRAELNAFWEVGGGRRFVALSDPGPTQEEQAAFTVCSKELRRTVQEVTGSHGLSAVVCVGGGNPPGVHNVQDSAPAALPMQAFLGQFAFNFGASALTVSGCMDAVVKAKGSVVLTSSVNAVTGIGECSYSVSKAAMHPYVHNLASHYGPLGVNANCVALGTVGPTGAQTSSLIVLTATGVLLSYRMYVTCHRALINACPRTHACAAGGLLCRPGPWVEALKQDPEILEKIGTRNPRGRVGSAQEAADVLLYLTSKEASLINGQVIVADGGWTLVAGTVDTANPDKMWFQSS